MHLCEVVLLPILLDPRHHQVPHYYLLTEVVFQDRPENTNVEQFLVVFHADALLALYSSHDLHIIELLLRSIEVFF